MTEGLPSVDANIGQFTHLVNLGVAQKSDA